MVRLEYQLGPLPVNLRTLFEPKGFLRILLLLIALLAFSITAGFNSGGTSNSVECTSIINDTFRVNSSAILHFNYPYEANDFSFTTNGGSGGTFLNGSVCTLVSFSTKPLAGSAQYFVAMGVLTMLYAFVLLLINIFFMTPEFFMAKYIAITDFIGSIIFSVFYLLACIAWSAGTAQLKGYAGDLLRQIATRCLLCDEGALSDAVDLQNFAQPAISLIFGWLEVFLWISSLWFVFKDTPWHAGVTNPLTSLYRSKSGEETPAATGERP